MANRFYKLAQLIKLAAKDVSREEAYWKCEDIAGMLDFKRTDSEPDVLEVTDDSGYRSIIIGDIRGNVSLDQKKQDNQLFHKGYVYLYSENCRYDKNKNRRWRYKCFPPTKDIADMLEKLYNAEYCPDIFKYYVGDDDDISHCVTYLSEVIKKYVDKIESDERTADSIFASCQD